MTPQAFEGGLIPTHAVRLRKHWQQTPVRLAAAVPRQARWPISADLMTWMQADRLHGAQTQLWRTPAPGASPCVPLDARLWTRERRLGTQLLTDLLDAPAVTHHLDQGGWLHVQHLHRFHQGVAEVLSTWQQALGLPLRAHLWQGQSGPARPHKSQILLPRADAMASRFLFILEGSLNAAWSGFGISGNRLGASAGDVLYFPPGQTLSLGTSNSAWVVELRIASLTPLSLLGGWAEQALQALRDDGALRRSDARGGTIDMSAQRRFAQALQTRLHTPQDIETAARNHQTRLDEDTTSSGGRLEALSRMFEADGQTRLVGHPDRLLALQQTPERLTLKLARKELHFDPRVRALLDFMLQPAPYRLAEAPGRHGLPDRLKLARSLAAEGLISPHQEEKNT